MEKPKGRMLAFSVQSSCFGHAVMEDRALCDWQIHGHNGASDEKRRKIVRSLIKRYPPTHIVLEDTKQPEFAKGKRAIGFIKQIEKECRKRKIDIVRVTSLQLREAVGAPSKATRQELAETLTQHFIQLIPHLPKPKKIWESEDKRMLMFIAVGMALAAEED